MGVKISYGKPDQTPEQKFLSDLQKWMIEEDEKAKAGHEAQQEAKEHGQHGPDAWKKLHSEHKWYSSMSGRQVLKMVGDKLSALSVKHKPEFD